MKKVNYKSTSPISFFLKHSKSSSSIFPVLPKCCFQPSTPFPTYCVCYLIWKPCIHQLFPFSAANRGSGTWLTSCLFFVVFFFFLIHQKNLCLSPIPTFCSRRFEATSHSQLTSLPSTLLKKTGGSKTSLHSPQSWKGTASHWSPGSLADICCVPLLITSVCCLLQVVSFWMQWLPLPFQSRYFLELNKSE